MLADAGVDFLLAESTGSVEHRKWVVQACLATGLPTWIGIKCRVEGDDPTPRVGYSSDVALDRGLDELVLLGGKVINMFHSNVKATDAALPIVREKWSGPIGVYPEAGREDYVDPLPDPTGKSDLTPAEFLDLARKRVQEGVQVIGGCCGIGPDRRGRSRLPPPARRPVERCSAVERTRSHRAGRVTAGSLRWRLTAAGPPLGGRRRRLDRAATWGA